MSSRNQNECEAMARGLHSSTFRLHVIHILCATPGGVSLSVTTKSQVELRSGRVQGPRGHAA
jgi:hypothetical protein